MITTKVDVKAFKSFNSLEMVEIKNNYRKKTSERLFENLENLVNDFMNGTKYLWNADLKLLLSKGSGLVGDRARYGNYYYGEYKTCKPTEICYNDYFYGLINLLNDKEKVNLKTLQNTLKDNQDEMEQLFTPIKIYTANKESFRLELVRLFHGTSYFGKKDSEAYKRIEMIYEGELLHHNIYSVEKTVSKMCSEIDNNGKAIAFPTISELEYEMNCYSNISLRLYANINWILSLRVL